MNEELKVAIELVQRHQDWRRGAEIEMENPKELGVSIDTVIEAARELLQLKDGTHPDMVMVPRKPTTEMLKAMADCDDDAPWIDLWEAALEAAQK